MAPTPPTQAAAPRVSVVLAVHDCAAYVELALRSVMEQTLRDIEIVVVDDASTDATPAILARLAASDGRVRVATLARNGGPAEAANHGLALARGGYVARMDADDIAEPARLAVQADYLDRHPDVTLCATSFAWIDAAGRVTRRSVRPRDSLAVRWLARFQLPLLHPSFMFRRADPSGVALRYDAGLRTSQDHDLVCRLLRAGGAAVCLPEVLMRYRRHAGAISVAKRDRQVATSAAICTEFQRAELPPALFAALAPLRDCYFGATPQPPARAVLAAAQAMLRHDCAAHPERAIWLRRQTAQLAAWALQRGGAGSGRIVGGFLAHGADLILPMALRLLETKRLLPPGLRSDPHP